MAAISSSLPIDPIIPILHSVACIDIKLALEGIFSFILAHKNRNAVPIPSQFMRTKPNGKPIPIRKRVRWKWNAGAARAILRIEGNTNKIYIIGYTWREYTVIPFCQLMERWGVNGTIVKSKKWAQEKDGLYWIPWNL